MKKIPTYLVRDWQGDRSRVLDEVTSGCEWVLAGEGVPTVKWDGTAVLIRDGMCFKRYQMKRGKAPPPNFEPSDVDPETGKCFGWVPVGDGPEDKWLNEGLLNSPVNDGTYELVGPKVQGNPYEGDRHLLLRHGDEEIAPDPGRTYSDLAAFFAGANIEGIVWHHPDGRMAKIKARDFGKRWPPKMGSQS